jgi:hypothetical protein
MHAIPWYLALLISIPETVLIIEFGFRLFNFHIKVKDIILLSVIIAIFSYFLSGLSISYAANTLSLIAILSLCTFFRCNIDIRYCFISVTLGVMIYGVLESFLLPLILQILKLSFDELIVNPQLNLITFIPVLIISMVILWFIIKNDIILYDLSSEESKE